MSAVGPTLDLSADISSDPIDILQESLRPVCLPFVGPGLSLPQLERPGGDNNGVRRRWRRRPPCDRVLEKDRPSSAVPWRSSTTVGNNLTCILPCLVVLGMDAFLGCNIVVVTWLHFFHD